MGYYGLIIVYFCYTEEREKQVEVIQGEMGQTMIHTTFSNLKKKRKEKDNCSHGSNVKQKRMHVRDKTRMRFIQVV